MSYSKINEVKIATQKYNEIKQIVNYVLNNNSQLTYTSMMNCLTQLYKNHIQFSRTLTKLQKFLKQINCNQTKTTHKLVNGATIDFQASIDLAFKNFQALAQNTMQNGEDKARERILSIMNFITELNYGQINQQSVKEVLKLIKNSEHLQIVDKDTLEVAFNRMLNYELSSRKFQGNTETSLSQIRKFANFASNSKNQQQDLKRQYQRMLKPAKEILYPLFTQMVRLKSFHKGFIQRLLTQNTKFKLNKQKSQVQDYYYEARQVSVEGLIQEAKYFRIQNERIKVVLAQLANMIKFNIKQLPNQQWRMHRRRELSQVKQDQNIYLSTIFEHLLTIKSTSPIKPVNQDPLGVARRSESSNYQKTIQYLETQIKNKTKQLQQTKQSNKNISKDLQQAQTKLKEREQSLNILQQKLKLIQNQCKRLQTEAKAKLNQFNSSGNRTENQLRKKNQQLEKKIKDINSSYNYLTEQYQVLQQSALQKEDAIRKLELKKQQLLQNNVVIKEDKIKDLQAKLKLKQINNNKEKDNQKEKLRKNLQDSQQIVDQLSEQLASAKRQNQDIQKQLIQLMSKGNAENNKEIFNNDSIILALKQNDKRNKETIQKYKKQNTQLTADLRLSKQKLKQTTAKYQELLKYSEENTVNLTKLTSIQNQLIQTQSNYNDLNILYKKLKNEVEADKAKTNNMKVGGQYRENTIENLQSQLKQKQIETQRFTQKFIKQTAQRDQQLTLLKLEIKQNNQKIEKLRDTSDVSKLSKKTVELQKQLEALSKENHELKLSLQRKERQILEIKIMKINQRN